MRTRILSFVLGFTSIIAQVVLLRELITVFYGNETAYGVILASWLFWICVGSFLITRWIAIIKNLHCWIIISQISSVFLLLITVFIVRYLKNFLGLQPGEIIGVIPMSWSVFILLAPLTIILGGMYTLICHGAITNEKQLRETTGTVYLWEAVGSAVGGVVLSFILLSFLSSFFIVFIVGFINILCIIYLGVSKGLKKVLYFLGFSFILLMFFVGKIELTTRQSQWKGYKVVIVKDSVYSNIVLIKKDAEYSLYENGSLSFTTDDNLSSESNVHYAVLEHPNPKEILLIGNGLGGALRECLKYRQAKIDYIELDKKVLDLSKEYLPEKVVTDLENKRVHVIIDDARRYLKTALKKYDVILANMPDPHTAFINRYYTLDFFKEAKEKLSENGIFSLSVSSSENYLSEEAKSFLRSIFSTLKIVFPDVVVIPGDRNIFIAFQQNHLLALDPQRFISRLEERQIKTQYVHRSYIPFILSQSRIDYINDVLRAPGILNTDTKPIVYLYDIILWSKHFDARFKNFLDGFQKVYLRPVIISIVGFFALGIIFFRKRSIAIGASIFTTGFCEIVFQMILMIAFQTLYGYVYYAIGMMIAAFMIGLIVGSFAGRKLLAQGRDIFKYYKGTQIAVCLYPLLLPFLFVAFRDAAFIQRHPFIFAGVFSVLPVLSGFIGGFQYPLAAQSISSYQKHISPSHSEGILYAVDTFGASLGAIFVAIVLIPTLGITSVAIMCSCLSFFVLIWLVVSR